MWVSLFKRGKSGTMSELLKIVRQVNDKLYVGLVYGAMFLQNSENVKVGDFYVLPVF